MRQSIICALPWRRQTEPRRHRVGKGGAASSSLRASLGVSSLTAHQIRSIVATIAVLGFVFRLVLAAVPMPPPSAQAGIARVPVCTVNGVKWVDVDPGAPKPASQAGSKCPMCLAAQGFALAVAVVAMPQPLLGTRSTPTAFHREAPVLRIAARPPPSRAPPSPSRSEAHVRTL